MLSVLPRELVLAYVFVIGACVGSFLNVVIARLPAGLSIVRPRSRCPRCGAAIAWYDNVPLASYLFLRARCRHCRASIVPRYFMVELLMAALAVALFVELGLSWQLLIWLPLAAAFLALAFLDIDHFWLPDVITLPAMVWAAAAAFLPGGTTPTQAALGLLPAAGLWAFAWAFLRLTGREGMGFGDIKLLAVLGLAFGPMGALACLFLGSVQGSLIGAIALLTHRQTSPQVPPSAQDPQASPSPQQPQVSPAPARPDVISSTGTAAKPSADDWVPPARAIPFGPFLILACYEILLVPSLLRTLFEWLTGVMGSAA